MRIMDEPYFIRNDDFWTYNSEKGIFELTEEGKKNKKARESYEEFYKELDKMEEGEHEGN